MGFFQKMKEAAEVRRQQREKEARKQQREKEKARKAFGDWLEEGEKELEALRQAGEAKAATLEKMLTDPSALTALSDVELEHLRLTMKDEVARYADFEGNLKQLLGNTKSPLLSFGIGALISEPANDKQLLLNLIEAEQQRRKQPKPALPPPSPATPSQRRTALLNEITQLVTQKATQIAAMQKAGVSQIDIDSHENLLDDIINKKRKQLANIP